MRQIAPEDQSTLRIQPIHVLHYADANDAELDVNQRFFKATEMMAVRTT
jgi:hypothetical protein